MMAEKPVAMVLGTFHMRRSDDMINTDAGDILGAKRQDEIRQCVELVSRFRPTKVAVEVVPARGEDLICG